MWKIKLKRLNKKHAIYGLIFIGLNILDALFTQFALSKGAVEVMPLANLFGANIVLKGLLAALIAGALLYFKKGKLLLWLDIGMAVIVTWGALVVFLFS